MEFPGSVVEFAASVLGLTANSQGDFALLVPLAASSSKALS